MRRVKKGQEPKLLPDLWPSGRGQTGDRSLPPTPPPKEMLYVSQHLHLVILSKRERCYYEMGLRSSKAKLARSQFRGCSFL